MTSKAPTKNVRPTTAYPWALALGHLLVIGIWSFAIGQDVAPLYQVDFEQSEPDKLPPDLKVLAGEFSVKQEGANRFLELDAVPLNSFGLLLGPERGADTSMRARLRGWPTGRRFPEFGIGLGGAGGYRLWLMPVVGELQLTQNDTVIARSSFVWKPGVWVHMHMEIRRSGESRWLIAGKAWHDGEAEPQDWAIRHEPTDPPSTGRASLSGTPYSERPIQFDDVRMEAR